MRLPMLNEFRRKGDNPCRRSSLDFSAPPSRKPEKNGVQVSKPVSPWNDLIACGPNPREIKVAGGGDRRRIGHTSMNVPLGRPRGESPQTPRAVPSPSVPQGRFRGRRKRRRVGKPPEAARREAVAGKPLGGRGGRKIRASRGPSLKAL